MLLVGLFLFCLRSVFLFYLKSLNVLFYNFFFRLSWAFFLDFLHFNISVNRSFVMVLLLCDAFGACCFWLWDPLLTVQSCYMLDTAISIFFELYGLVVEFSTRPALRWAIG